MWFQKQFFKYLTGICLLLLAIFLLGRVQYILAPIKNFITILFFPLLFAGFLYYILKPIVKFLSKNKYIPHSLAILVVFLFLVAATTIGAITIGKTIKVEYNQFSEEIPMIIKQNKEQTKQIIEQNNFGLFTYQEVKQKALSYLGNKGKLLGENLSNILSSLTNFFATLLAVPFVLFYLLKDGHRLQPFLLKYIPEKHEKEGKKLLGDIDNTLSTYIGGQVLIAIIDGTLMYIGYLLMGLDYSLILALTVVVTAVIPVAGPLLGILPALFIALITKPSLILWVFILLVIVQQLEGNFISPLIIGNKLSIHPLTVILLLLSAGISFGFLGILLAVPVYSVLKVIFKNLYHLYRLRHS